MFISNVIDWQRSLLLTWAFFSQFGCRPFCTVWVGASLRAAVQALALTKLLSPDKYLDYCKFLTSERACSQRLSLKKCLIDFAHDEDIFRIMDVIIRSRSNNFKNVCVGITVCVGLAEVCKTNQGGSSSHFAKTWRSSGLKRCSIEIVFDVISNGWGWTNLSTCQLVQLLPATILAKICFFADHFSHLSIGSNWCA